MQESPIRQQIVWLDCCAAGELLNFDEADPTDRGKSRDRCFIAASRNYEASFEQMDGAHGELTGALLRALDPAEHPGGMVDNHSLVSHLLRNWKSGLQRPIVHNSGHQILFQRAAANDGEIESESSGVCPYKGLSYFDFNEEDPEYFFGRTALTDVLLEKVRDSQSNFLAVLGPSGSGKSSVVRAGLLHQLRKGERISGSEGWKIRICKPVTLDAHNPTVATGEDQRQEPLENLAMGLVDPALSGVDFAAALRKTRELLKEGLVDLVKAETRDGGRLVLFIDQFEEIFTLWKSNENKKTKEAEYAGTRKAFFQLLFGALDQLENRIQLILAMRADFLGKCTEEQYSGLPRLIQDNLVTVTPMTPKELLEAIKGPARQVGLSVQGELADQMVADVKDSPGILPLLQFALTELWKAKIGKQIDFRAYGKLEIEVRHLGAVKGLLARRADEVYEEKLDSEEKREIAERIFKDMTQPGEGTEDTRRQVFKESLIRRAEETALVSEVLHVLADANLIVTSSVTEKGKDTEFRAVVDVAHEALIRHWPRLRDWIDQNRDDMRFYRRVEEAAERWIRNGKPDGLLYRSLDLEQLKKYKQDFELEMSEETINFFHTSRVRAKKEEEADRENKRLRTRLLFQSCVTHASLLANPGLNDFAKAKKTLEKTRKLDPDVSASLRYTRNLVDWFVNLMGCKGTQVFTENGKVLSDVSVSPDMRFMAVGGDRGTLVVFNAQTGDKIAQLKGHDPKAGQVGAVYSIAFHPKGELLFSGADDATIRRWSTRTWKEERPAWRAHAPVTAISINPDGSLLASGGTDKAVTIWEIKDGVRRSEALIGHKKNIAVRGLAFSYDSRRLASASYDGTARIWELNNMKCWRVLSWHTDAVQNVVFSQDGRFIATCSSDATIMVWEANSKRPPLRRLRGHQNMVFGLRFVTLPDQKRESLVSTSLDGTVRLWDVESGVPLRVLQGPKTGINGLALFNGNGSNELPSEGLVVFSVSNGGKVWHWNIESSSLRRIAMPTEPTSAAISPTGKIVSVGFSDGSLRVLDMANGKVLSENTDKHKGDIQRLSGSALN